ncbi:APC family permease [Rhodococcus sp. APC 3903]|uniref:APC family permease n=1 Tax=Rhodococcus sp. APC 3903 TaxID=3035193 RepID=UPI0025B56469|nr:APC family permease [Rhodococcus sp. APC 3903]MDN3460768.1 APC family permease [Rhodococcus sp. APC 3903]
MSSAPPPASIPHDVGGLDSPAPAGLRPGRLGVAAIMFFVIAAVAPMAAVIGASPVVFSANGATAPLVYLLAALLFAVFSVGYVAMSRHISNAGGFVAYIARGLGAKVATAAAGVAVLAYTALQAALWSQFSVFGNQLISDKLGIDIPTWVLMFGALAIVTALTIIGVDVSLKVLGVLVALEIAAFVILDVAIIASGGASGNSLAAFDPSNLVGPGIGIAFLFCITCFTGFEATVVFSEEAKDRHRTIPRAVYGSIGFIGIFYALTTWAVGNSVGNTNVQSAATEDPAGFIFAVATTEVGPWLSTTMEVLVVTSFLAMLIGFQNMFARYLYALGRAGALPNRLGIANPKTSTPAVAAACVGVTLALVLIAFVLAGADPITVTFSWLLSLGTVALIAILTFAAISVVAFFARTKVETNIWKTRIAPGCAATGFAVVIYLALTNYGVLLGGQGGTAQWLLLLIPAFAVLGFSWAVFRPSIDFEAELV